MNKISSINDIHNAPHTLDVNNSHDLSATPNEPDAHEFHAANANTLEQHQFRAALARLFRQLPSQDIEQFYQSYQRWMLEQQIEIQQSQIAALQQKIAQNAALMEQIRPSAIALSALAQLQASGVEDIELLDQMLERGETWLDRTMQQLAYCERLDLIGESYTAWCRHALEGAYDWIESIQEAETIETSAAVGEESSIPETATVTENLLLQKLMSDDDTGKMGAPQPRITAPLPVLDETSSASDDITTIIAIPPTTEIVEATTEVAPATAETTEESTALAAIDSPVAAAANTMAEVESGAATAFEHAEASSPETEQESAEPIAQAIPETLEVTALAISQPDTDVEIDEPEQEEQPKEITIPDAAETMEDDAASADDEIAIDLVLANEVEEAELIEPAEFEEAPQSEEVEAPSAVVIEPSTDAVDVIADEALSEHAAIATEVMTPAEDAASATIDTEDILTTVEQEEEQEAEVPDAPSDSELVKDEGITFSPIAEPPPQEEISPPSVQINTESGSVEAARSPQEQPPASQPFQKPGFFKRLLAFLLS